MRNRVLLISWLPILVSPLALPADDFRLEEGFVRLDNGKDLTGWKASPGSKACFSVQNGNIRVTDRPDGPKGGRLESTQTHGPNVIIRLQYRAARGADSAVFVYGRQFQVRDYENSYEETKRLAAFDRPAGQWNDLEFDFTDGVAVVRLNGKVAQKGWPIGKEPRRGFGLQKEVGNFAFRFIRIKEKRKEPAGRPDDRKPNIVLVIADDLGYGHLSCYPQIDTIRTPTIELTLPLGTVSCVLPANAPYREFV